ncbi:hypothetical protein HID58_047696 [Brassica napus]|uniref:Uncharacterized protein n=1 Tax=Brassica napus TaxID=3708 RepID=A0ABQ8B067_BRANA|nr:hypothetical protein HID58_047696 [Brassica napus]
MVEEQILMHKLYEQWFTLRQKRRRYALFLKIHCLKYKQEFRGLERYIKH